MNYTLTRQAEEDFLHITQYLTNENPHIALRFIDAVEQTCELIISQPEMGRTVDLIHQRNIRRFHIRHFQNYTLFYRIQDDNIEIIRISHSARDLPALFRD